MFLKYEPVSTFLWKHSSDREAYKACLFEIPYKCGGGYNSSDKDILSYISWLKLSKGEARQETLEVMEKNKKEFEAIAHKDSLTDFEEFRLNQKDNLLEYHKRLLYVIDKLE